MVDTLLILKRLVWPVPNLGYGKRIGFWVAGCDRNCPGCCSTDTHSANGMTLTVDEWLKVVDQALGDNIPDGVTFSGGEVALQHQAVIRLARALRNRYPGIDILIYSGFPWRELERDFSELISVADVFIPEPYVGTIPPTSPLHGSGNQPIKLLTPLATQRYGDERSFTDAGQLVVTSITGEKIAAVGVPHKIDQLSAALRRRGIALVNPSWEKQK